MIAVLRKLSLISIAVSVSIFTPWVYAQLELFSTAYQSQPFTATQQALLKEHNEQPEISHNQQQLAILYFLFNRTDLLQPLAQTLPAETDPQGAGLKTFLQGFVQFDNGHYAKADPLFESALSQASQHAANTEQHDKWLAIIKMYRAINHAYQQHYTQAIDQLGKIRVEAERKSWPTITALADFLLGDVNYQLQDYEAALTHYQRAEAGYSDANRLLKAHATMARSQMINIVGERPQAFALLEQAITVFQHLEDTSALAYAYLLMSYYFDKDGSPEEALEWIAKSVTLREQLGNVPDIANAYVHYASLLNDNGYNQKALIYGKNSVDLVQGTDDLAGLWDAHVIYANILYDARQYKAAFENMRKGERALLKKARLDMTSEAARLNSEFSLEIEQLRNQQLDHANEVLGAKLALNEQKQRFQTWLMAGLVTLVLVFAVTVIVIYRLYKKNRQLANHDVLTGINNRRKIMEIGEQSFSVSKRYNQPLSVLMLDIDNFKSINDKFGHNEGDNVLLFIANQCSSSLRSSDCVGRIGGEEFLFVLPNTTADEAAILANRLCNAIKTTSEVTDMSIDLVTVSIGVAEFKESYSDFIELVNQADMALYDAKNKGRDQVGIASLPQFSGA
ncbi:GGDEF domain-containing protein [Alteromonas gilva]|uniref:diguanylate cyclase n=1 Tax=Alteromonas gilva TaxID=2987522 RepID=A0ABT5KZS8_9ALTE|nr:GGDEF domain-containing protein [Alteromonas gilva]MDC8830277.1 GGDEF domain-containing protein [Alteromonas gilva]